MKHLHQSITLITALLFSTLAMADIKLDHTAEVESVVKDKEGKESIKRAPADKVIPGDVLVYTITATNTGKEAVDKVTITDAISEHNMYLVNSANSTATGKDITITFSADHGKTFAPAAQLMVQDKEGKRQAMPEEYTNIRWQLNFAIPPGKNALVWFKAKLK